MAINKNYIVVFDFETSSADPYTTQPLELAAVVIDPRSLKRVDNSEFCTLIKPDDWKNVDPGALVINKIDPSEVDEKGLELKTAFDLFVQFVSKYNIGMKNWDAPGKCGHNNTSFDNIIIDRLCQKFKYVDNLGRTKLFHPFKSFDTISICDMWFENLYEPKKYGLDTLRDFFGISKEGAHRALKDVEDTADIYCRFIQFHRNIHLKNKPKFKGCFSKKEGE